MCRIHHFGEPRASFSYPFNSERECFALPFLFKCLYFGVTASKGSEEFLWGHCLVEEEKERPKTPLLLAI